MGAGVARQLVRHGHEVRVWNRSRDKAEPLADDGAAVADEVAEAVDGADVVLVMVFDADAVLDVLEQAAPALGDDAVVVQSSTVGLHVDRVAEAAERLGVRLLDAPVLGTRKPAEEGTLVVLASGDPALRAAADPVLDAIGSRTVWVGDEVGAASRLKLVGNAWLGALTAGIAQSVALAEGLGLDPRLFLEAIDGSPTDTPYAHLKGGAMISGEMPVAFDVAGLTKDLRLIREAAERHGVATDLTATVLALFERAAAAGHEHDDIAAVRAAY